MADAATALVLDLNADTRKSLKALDALTKRLEGLAPELEAKGKKAMKGLENGLAGDGFAKALDKVFDSSRLAVLEEGSTKIRLFGSALEPLGTLGIAAAAGIAAVGIAAEEARKAMEWADDLDRTAKKLGTTTTSLQEFDYASVATSIGLEQGREALSLFNEKIGAFESHVRDKTMEKFAAGVQLTRKEVSETIDPVEKLRLVMEKISTLPNAQQRTSAAKAFGLDALLPLINEGSEGIDKFIAKMREARENGSVIDPRAIAEAAELNDKVEELSYRISQDFRKAFIELAPAIESVAEFMERTVRALTDFLGSLPDAVRGMRDLANSSGQGQNGWADHPGPVERFVAGAYHQLAERGRAAKLGDRIKDMLAGKPVNLAGSDFDPALRNQGAGRQLAFDTPKHGPRDETLNFDKAAQDAYDSGLKALLSAQAALTGDIQERADLEKQALAADLDKKLADLDAEEEKIRKSKNDAHKKEQLALIETAKTEEKNAAAAKVELNKRQTAFAIEDQLIELYKSKLDAQIGELQAQAGIASTAKERAALEVQILALKRQEERDLHDAQIDRRTHTATNPGGDLSPEQAAALKGDFNANQDAQNAAQLRQIYINANPVAAYLESLKDVNAEMQNAGVTAARDLATGLADAIANAKNLGDVAKNVFRQMIADLLAAAIKKDIVAPLLAFIPGFASGTNSAPGGLALVGERGPELVNLPKGSKVTPSHQTLQALQSMQIPKAASPIIVQQSLMFDNRGAVMTDDLLRQMNAMAAGAQQRAVAQSLALGKKQLPDVLRSQQMLRG